MSSRREIPDTPWSTHGSRWRAGPLSLGVLVVGLWVFGTGEALLVAATLGNSPWTVLAQGVALHSPLSIGASTFAVSVVLLLLWVPLRERPGLGTLLNAVVIAVALDVMLRVLPTPEAVPVRLLGVGAGVLVLAAGGALYLTANLGPGPRDGLMTGLHTRFGWRIAGVRTGLELTALTAGWLLGGRVGIGTVVFAVGVGPALGLFLTALRRAYPQVLPPGGGLGGGAPPLAAPASPAVQREPPASPTVRHTVSRPDGAPDRHLGRPDGTAVSTSRRTASAPTPSTGCRSGP